MHPKLQACWQRVLDSKGGSSAVIDAVTERVWTFEEINARADAWLARHPQARGGVGQVWCLALADRAEWLAVFLASIKTGAVVLPVEPDASHLLGAQAKRSGASLLVAEAGVEALTGGTRHKNCLLIKLTSGTTGEPKPLPFTEAEMLADGEQIMQSMSITTADRNFAVIPLGHSYGLGNLVLPFFMVGVPIVLGSSPYPQVMLEELTRYPCTVLPLVPPLVKALAAVGAESAGLQGMRLILSAGSALKPEIARQFHAQTGRRVHNFYGSSETGGICFDRSGQAAQTDGAVGSPLVGVELSLTEAGAVHIRSEALCHALYPAGVATLHDFGCIDEGGVLRLTGRHADIVKIAGRRMSLSEIEAALCALEGVEDVYVTVREGRSGETRCVAIFAGSAEADAIRRQLAAGLPDWKVPKALRRVDQITNNARGKKDRQAMERVVDALI